MVGEKTRKFVPLTNDILFKDAYSRKENIKYLEDLLECYYGYPRGYFKDKLKVSRELTLDKTRFDDKNIRGDLVVEIDNKLKLNIEMYSDFNEKAKKKSKYYALRIYSTQLDSGMDYNEIGKVTQINFIDNVRLEISEEIKSTLFLDHEDINIEFVRLDIARKINYTGVRFIKYLKFLGAQTKEERDKYALGDEILSEFNSWLDWYSNTDTLDNAFNDEYWRKQIYHEDGRLDGIEEKANEIAKSMLKDNMSLDIISKHTKLSIEAITKLKEKLDTEN